jgi:inorganic pyrophosphatase
MKIVTSGLTFLDIDAYAGCVAYAELLNLQGISSIAFSSASINESVTQTIRSWNAPLVVDYNVQPEDTFVLIDVSEPDFFEKNVDINKVEEVIDHHVGYEDFWKEKLGSKANIDFIGAACTQVYESWVRAGVFDQMSKTSARLLITGILDNTLNFKAVVTTDRDRGAYEALLKIADLPDDWTARYFEECEEAIFNDISIALINDTKVMKFKNLSVDDIAFGQLVIWNADKAIHEYREILEKTLAAKSEDWFVNIVSISHGESFFLASNSVVINWAEDILNVAFHNGLAFAGKLWLRKEIVKKDASS